MPDAGQLKKELRKKYRTIRNSLGFSHACDSDVRISNKVLSMEEYKKASLILTYVSAGSEVDTSAIILRALAEGKKVACPRCNKENHTMSFRYIVSLDELEEGAYGIFEPKPDAPPVQPQEMAHSVCLVPGLAFDTSGARLGYGGGYYDRFLDGYRGVSIGLCRSACLSDHPLPRDRYDAAVERIVTDRTLFVIT